MSDAVRLVRHATLQIELAGHRVLVDPMLGPAEVRPPVANTPAARRNPLVELPEPADAVVEWAQAVLVTHLHADHLDPEAEELIGGRLPLFCQPGDEDALRERGLAQAARVDDRVEWAGMQIARTGGRHGTGAIADRLGPVSGFVLSARGAPTVYVAGDTVWCTEVEQALAEHEPDVVVVNAGGARFLEGDPITMTPEDVLAVRAAAPAAMVVAVHMDAINHCVVTRACLAAAAGDARIVVPGDGERVALAPARR